MDILPFPDVGALSVKVVREGAMPNVSWRNIGAAHGSVNATKPNEVNEQAFSIGNSVVIDKVYMKDRSPRLYNPLTYQTTMTVRGIARNFTDAAINGLPGDLTRPVGLHFRTNNELPAAVKIAGGGLDISPDAVGLAANIQTFLDFLDQTIYNLTDSFDPTNGVYLLCNDTVIQRVQSTFRQSGLLNLNTDPLGRTFMDYKGAKFVDMGRTFDDTTRIILNTELDDGTALVGGDATSIYGIRVGNEYFTAWQEYGLEVGTPMLDPTNQVLYTSVIDWVVGLAVSHPRYSVARLHGIVAA
jgi:hypothetical protein